MPVDVLLYSVQHQKLVEQKQANIISQNNFK